MIMYIHRYKLLDSPDYTAFYRGLICPPYLQQTHYYCPEELPAPSAKEKRSQIMSRIWSKNTKPEKILRSALHQLGYRFRVHKKDLSGKPDIILSKYNNTVIFVHGCFWYYHKDCKEGRIPSTNSKFWKENLSRNVERDNEHENACSELGWKVAVVWEFEVEKHLNDVVTKIEDVLHYDA